MKIGLDIDECGAEFVKPWCEWAGVPYQQPDSWHHYRALGLSDDGFVASLLAAGRGTLGDDVWVRALFDNAESDRLVISDVRYPNEADAVRERGGYVIRVNRPGVGPLSSHRSQIALDSYDFDAVVTNDSTIEVLGDRVNAAVSELVGVEVAA